LTGPIAVINFLENKFVSRTTCTAVVTPTVLEVFQKMSKKSTEEFQKFLYVAAQFGLVEPTSPLVQIPQAGEFLFWIFFLKLSDLVGCAGTKSTRHKFTVQNLNLNGCRRRWWCWSD
jgi:hypothetical protein